MLVPVQVPAWQLSPLVQALPSLQLVPSACTRSQGGLKEGLWTNLKLCHTGLGDIGLSTVECIERFRS